MRICCDESFHVWRSRETPAFSIWGVCGGSWFVAVFQSQQFRRCGLTTDSSHYIAPRGWAKGVTSTRATFSVSVRLSKQACQSSRTTGRDKYSNQLGTYKHRSNAISHSWGVPAQINRWYLGFCWSSSPHGNFRRWSRICSRLLHVPSGYKTIASGNSVTRAYLNVPLLLLHFCGSQFTINEHHFMSICM